MRQSKNGKSRGYEGETFSPKQFLYKISSRRSGERLPAM